MRKLIATAIVAFVLGTATSAALAAGPISLVRGESLSVTCPGILLSAVGSRHSTTIRCR